MIPVVILPGNVAATPNDFLPIKNKSREELLEAANTQLEQKSSMGARCFCYTALSQELIDPVLIRVTA